MKRSLTLIMTAALLASSASASVAQVLPSDREAKIQAAREFRTSELAAVKNLLLDERDNIAAVQAESIARLKTKLATDISRAQAIFPTKDLPARIKKLNQDYAKAEKAIKNKSIIDLRRVMKEHTKYVKEINADFAAKVKAAG